MKTKIGVVILVVLIVAVTSHIPRDRKKHSDEGRMNPFDVREDSKEANEFLKPREPCNEICYENCYEEALGSRRVPNCNHCGSDC